MRILFSSPAPSLPVEPPETRFGILVMTAVEDGDARISRHASVTHGEVETFTLRAAAGGALALRNARQQ